MPYSPLRTAPDYLYSSVHPVTGELTLYHKSTASDLSFSREGAFLSLPFADGAINLYSGSAAPIKGPRTFVFEYLHTYDPLDPTDNFTKQRDLLMKALGHGMETDFYVFAGDGSYRKGVGSANTWDFRETIGAISVFEAKISFECANPYLVDLFETGTIQWDNGEHWDIGKEVQQLVAATSLTGGTFRLAQGGNTTVLLSAGVGMDDVNFGLSTATPSAIPYTCFAALGTPLFTTPPKPMYLVSNSRGAAITPITITANTLTGGPLSIVQLQAASNDTPINWDQNALYYPLTGVATTKSYTAKGNAPDREMKITLYGSITGPIYVESLLIPGGQFGHLGFRIDTDLSATDILVIDLGLQSVTKNGIPIWDKFVLPEGQEEWMRSEAGANTVYIQATALSGNAKLSTRGHYL